MNKLLQLGINLHCFDFLSEVMVIAQAKNNTARHVSGQEVAVAFKELAIKQFGGLARVVLLQWGLNSTIDIGNLIYKLIDAKVYSKEPDDSLDDFIDVYDFDEVFSLNTYMKTFSV